jgi:hypothetical protein
VVPSLLPSHIESLRQRFDVLYANRPALRQALISILGALDSLWDRGGALPSDELARLDAELLPLLNECAAGTFAASAA